jgi:hypothetical protein
MFYSVKVPRVFFVDHLSRCLSRDVVTRSTSRGVVVDLEGREVADLLSDADYWSTEWVDWDSPAAFGFGSSARATANAIRKQFDAATLEQFRNEWREYVEYRQSLPPRVHKGLES